MRHHTAGPRRLIRRYATGRLFGTVQRRLVPGPEIRIPAWLGDAPAHSPAYPGTAGDTRRTLTVSRRACGSVVVVTVRGRLDIDGSPAVDHRFQQTLAAGNLGCLVIDLSRVNHLDGYGVRTLLRGVETARTSGIRLRVVTGDGAALRGLDEHGVRPLLPIAPDVDTACSTDIPRFPRTPSGAWWPSSGHRSDLPPLREN